MQAVKSCCFLPDFCTTLWFAAAMLLPSRNIESKCTHKFSIHCNISHVQCDDNLVQVPAIADGQCSLTVPCGSHLTMRFRSALASSFHLPPPPTHRRYPYLSFLLTSSSLPLAPALPSPLPQPHMLMPRHLYTLLFDFLWPRSCCSPFLFPPVLSLSSFLSHRLPCRLKVGSAEVT